MKVVILAGGKGIRMGPLTKDIPKPMVLLDNKPILEFNFLTSDSVSFLSSILIYLNV